MEQAISKMETTEKQINMKLYTEEQVKEMIDDAHNGIDGYYNIFKKHMSISLPSDEEIEKEKHSYFPDVDSVDMGTERFAFKMGAKWMRDKILNK